MTKVFVPYGLTPKLDWDIMNWIQSHAEVCVWIDIGQTQLLFEKDEDAIIFRLTFGL